jgi:oligopeptide transport system substrate-binding protein
MQLLDSSVRFRYPFHDSEANRELIARILRAKSERNRFCITSHDQKPPYAFWQWQKDLLSLHLFCFFSQEFDQQNFFLELIRNHPILREAVLCSFQAIPFYLKKIEGKLMLLLSGSFIFEGEKMSQKCEQSLDQLVKSLSLGIHSPEMAQFCIRTSVLIASQHFNQVQIQKIFQIQKTFEHVLDRYVDHIDAGLFSELASFLSCCSSVFFKARTSHHLKRVIFSQYIMRRNVKKKLLNHPDKRHLDFRLFNTELLSHFEKKAVLGIMVVLSFQDKYESFDQEHILRTIQRWIPQARLVQGSSYAYQNIQDAQICTIYLEIYKEKNSFSLEELLSLRKILCFELKECVQKLMPALFTLRNEEQVMKNIIVLNREIHCRTSLPQVMIHFEKQQDADLVFVVMIVYVDVGQKIEEALMHLPGIDTTLERKEIVGYLQELPKKALVLRLTLFKSKEFLRKDFSVNIHLARNKVYSCICRAIGEVRDYDGGLILKQQELFSELQQSFSRQLDKRGELLENFFYSISPIERQATILTSVLKKMFSMVLASLDQTHNDKGSYFFSEQKDDSHLFIFIRAEEASLNKMVKELIKTFSKKILATSFFSIQENFGIGVIIESTDLCVCQRFLFLLKSTLESWKDERKQNRVLRLNLDKQALTLDPRMLKDAVSKEVLQMLFEGLVRIGPNGKPENAIARAIDISPCRKTYIFHIRDCKWSDGSSIVAESFEYSWKKILSPDFVTPYAHYLFPIKNAHSAKKRKISLSEVGVRALDTKTLQVDLENPLPYFLELLSLPIFSPIHHLMDKIHPHWPTSEGKGYLCNGPFRLKKNQLGEVYIFEKNPFYWDAENIFLNQIILSHTNAQTALKLFEKGELDWLGYPMRFWDPLFELAKNENSERLHLLHRVYWTTFNTQTFPLNNKKLRQALSFSLNRQELAKTFPLAASAFSPLPPNHAYFFDRGSPEGDASLAIQLFEESLKELCLTRKTFPVLHFFYRDSKNMQALTEKICKQWEKVLNIEIQTQSCSTSLLFQKIMEKDYQIANVSWLPWVNDPLYTLYAFYSKDDYLNFPNWESAEFQNALKEAIQSHDKEKRVRALASAESILINESPVIALVAEKNPAIKKKSLKIKLDHEFADFKKAIFSN